MLQILSESTLEPITTSNDSVFENPGRPSLSSWGRKRASAACRICRERKVRCDLTTKGPPCSNCIHDGVVCTVTESKRRKSSSAGSEREPLSPTAKAGVKRKSVSKSAVIKEGRESEYSPRLQINPSFTKLEPALSPRDKLTLKQEESPRRQSEPVTSYLSPTDSASSTSYTAVRDTYTKAQRKPSIMEVEMADALTSLRSWNANTDNEHTSSSRASDQPNESDTDSKEENLGLVYTGDASAYTFVTMIQRDFRDVEGHGWIPSKAAPHTLPEIDILFLKSKGAFLLPNEELFNELLFCYFKYIHPFLPVVEERPIRRVLQEEGTSGVPLLLLQSMFFVASGFARRDIMERSGFKNRRQMKKTFYDRAKILCDLDYEQNKLIVISSTLIMSHYFVHPSYRYNNWFWSNYALGICQSLGFHREPKPAVVATTAEKRLWKRIWWSTFARAVFVAFGMGQSISINMDDCDVLLPVISELYEPFDRDAEAWAGLFLFYLKFTVELAKILQGLYSGTMSKTWKLVEIRESDGRLKKLLREFESWRIDIDLSEYCRRTKEFSLFNGYLESYFNTAVILLFRPIILEGLTTSPGLHGHVEVGGLDRAGLQEESRQRISDAASSMDVTIEHLISIHLAEFFNTQMLSCMIPSMATHLYESVTAPPLLKRIARHKIELYLIVMRELEDAYPSAEFGIRFFNWALEKVDHQAAVASGELQKPKKRKTRSGSGSSGNHSTPSQQTTEAEQVPYANLHPGSTSNPPMSSMPPPMMMTKESFGFQMPDGVVGVGGSDGAGGGMGDDGCSAWPPVPASSIHSNMYDEMWLGMLLGAESTSGMGMGHGLDDVQGG